MLYLINLCQFLPDLIDFSCIFQRTDGKCGGKIIISAFLCQSGSRLHTKAITLKAALPAFRDILKSPCHSIKIFWLIFSLHQSYRMKKLHLMDQPADLCHSFFIFFLWRNIWIIKKHSNRKKPGKIFQDLAAAGCAACMKEKPRDFSFLLIFYDQFFKLFLIIYICQFFHPFSLQSRNHSLNFQ